jgi:hypothetical protein
MNETVKIRIAVILCCGSLLINCKEESGYKKYQQLVKRELAQGERKDSLFLGVYLGMSSKAFYMHCWDMNKKGLFTDGADNTAVQYKITAGLKYPGTMNFYPQFHDGKISKMGVSFRYDGWAPWNKHMISDSLKKDVLHLYNKWYPDGNSFIKIEDKERGVIYVKIDNNRRIIIGSYDEAHVKVDYTDLLTEQQLKK